MFANVYVTLLLNFGSQYLFVAWANIAFSLMFSLVIDIKKLWILTLCLYEPIFAIDVKTTKKNSNVCKLTGWIVCSKFARLDSSRLRWSFLLLLQIQIFNRTANFSLNFIQINFFFLVFVILFSVHITFFSLRICNKFHFFFQSNSFFVRLVKIPMYWKQSHD